MPDINILSPHLADLIAAGEVVERPASVIKELMENSFDAGARNVTVEIREGGLTFMRVTDDGCGMLPEDAGVCFLRHATSKLREEGDLTRIGTMGFRGEALAAISSVSDIELLTRKRGSDTGTRVKVTAGDITDMAPWGCPEGTSITVSALFRNTPARLKFLKSDKSEAAACTQAALRCALGRPEVSVRFIRDGREEFFSPGDGQQKSCVYTLLGRDLSNSMIPCSAKDELLSVSGFIGSPSAGQGSRAKQFFFCNGRCIRSTLLQAAVEQAYKNTLLTGRFPSCVLWLEISPSAVDVNVHPAKTEVRFRDERKVFDAVYFGAMSALEGETGRREISSGFSGKSYQTGNSQPVQRAKASASGDFFQSMSSAEFLKKQAGSSGYKTGHHPVSRPAPTDAPPGVLRVADSSRSPYVSKDALEDFRRRQTEARPPEAENTLTPPAREPVQRAPVQSEPEQISYPVSAPAEPPSAPIHEDKPPTPAESCDGPPLRIVGEAMKTYIIVERDGELIFIDKHAAHERMIFDRLKAQDREVMCQTLLEPVVVKAGPGDVELVEANSDTLASLGLELEPYGESSLILRTMPADTDAAEAPALVEEICEKLRRGMKLSPEDALDGILHTVACKAAIKAGRSADSDELMKLAEAVVSGQVKYCPHGRPVSISLTKKQLDKEFSRIV